MVDIKETEKKFFERQLVIFNIGSEEFGVDISDVREIIKYEQTTLIPSVDDCINGIINLRGQIVVIVDLAKKIGLPSSKINVNTRIIVTLIKSDVIGFIVDSCNEVLRLTGDMIRDPPQTILEKINGNYIQGVGIVDKRIITIIDLAKVMAGYESSQLKNEESCLSNKKILIVDDSTMMRATLRTYIDPRNFTIIEADDGDSALKTISSEKPDLVLLDIKMPKKDGIEVLKQIKTNYPDITVVMETSVYDEETKNQCLSLGAKEYLKKPISKKQIEDVLQLIK